MGPDLTDITVLTSYGICCLAYLCLTVVMAAAKWPNSAKRGAVMAGCLSTVLWSAAVIADALWHLSPVLEQLLEGVRNVLWLFVLLSLLGQAETASPERTRRIPLMRVLPLIVAAVAATTILPLLIGAPDIGALLETANQGVEIIISVLGLLAVENLIRNSDPSARWGVKHLCLGLGAIFSYDFFLHADSMLLRQVDADFAAARGMVTALAVPLLAVSLSRGKSWDDSKDPEFSFSHRGAFHSVALLSSGLYLLAMAALAYHIREIGGIWGGSMQITFMIGGLLLLFVVFTSGTLKSQAKIIVQKYFFTYKYDYREEWIRFVRAVSSRHPLTLGERLLHAIATMMDSPAGSLWVWRRQDDAFCPEAAWNYHGARPSALPDSPLIAFFRGKDWIVEIDELQKWPERYGGLDLPSWISDHRQAWLIVPFIHRGEVLGFLVLDRARAPRRLDWEDRDLLKTTAAHAAGYLAEEIAADALSEAQKLEVFNRRFAFVAHDIKNVVGQMGLLVDNAEKFGDNPEFQKDMLDTVRNSVTRLRTLLDQLSAKRRPTSGIQPVNIRTLVETLVARWRKTNPGIVARIPDTPAVAMAVEGDLVSALDFLVDNAITAAGSDGSVSLALRGEDDRVIIEVRDTGRGMDSDFIQKELFRPLKSTKTSGYGIGAYQTRHLVREMGGQLEVDSVLDEGTTMRILLPKGENAPRATGPDPRLGVVVQ